MDGDKEASRSRGRAFGAILLTAMAGLVLEIGLTRLFSVLFFPPTVFGILSLAIAGIGLGAALVTGWPRWRNPAYVPLYLGGAALSVIGTAAAAVVPALYLALWGLVVLPYFFIGMSLTTLFSYRPQHSPQLYLADLVGAGVGVLLAVPLLDGVGGLQSVLATAVPLAAAAVMLSQRPLAPLPLTGLALLCLPFASSWFLPWFTIDMAQLPAAKPLADSLAQPASALIATRWDAFARTDLVDPGDGGPYRLYLDGAAGSIMPPAVDNDFLWQDIGFFPFATEQPQSVFLIGPGGGLDVWFALQSGAAEIVAVEVNQASVDLVRDYAPYHGDLYGRTAVTILVDDGRSVLGRDETHYDLIFLSQLLTLAAERNGYALVENGVYTVEAFGEFLTHLTPEGQIGMKLYDEPTLTRALATALAALRQQGMASSDQAGLQHIIALLDGDAQPPIPLLIVSKTPFSREDALSLGAVAQQVGFTPLFLPGLVAQPPLAAVAAGTLSLAQVTADLDNDLSPTTDDRPFFFQFERGLPRSLRPLWWGISGILLLGLGLLIGHQWRVREDRRAVTVSLYFAGLGMGFIIVEIGVIQQTRLFLGHPTTAITVVLATLLISGGLGSGLAGWRQGQATLAAKPMLFVIGMLVVWLLLWPWVRAQFVGAVLWLRILVVTASLLPLGLTMGMPFPRGLQAVAAWGQRPVAVGWAVNGLMSVVGSVLAITLAVQIGFEAVLVGGGIAYGVAAAATWLRS